MGRKILGASLAQYAILIGVLSIVLVPSFYIHGQIISDHLSNFLNGIKIDDTLATTSSTTTTTPTTPTVTAPTASVTLGPFGGTPAVPVRECTGDTCTIDFGSFTLNGIKDDFPGFVETAGTAAGAEELANILDTLAEAADNGLIDVDSELIRKLANRGHDVASASKDVEDQLDLMKDGTTTATTIKNNVFDYILSLDDTGAFGDTLTEVNDQLPASTQEEKNVKELINFLAEQIYSINDTFINSVDPLVAGLDNDDTLSITQIQSALDLNASDYTDLDSQIICKTGDGEDPGDLCK